MLDNDAHFLGNTAYFIPVSEAPLFLLRRGNQWVILAGFQLGILLDLIFMRGRKETIELAA